MLQIKNIHKNLNKIKLVDGVSFEIEENKIVALTGPDGSGKSTLLDILTGIQEPSHGKIIFNEKNITNLCPYKITNLGITRVFAESKLFLKKTVQENLVHAFNEPFDHFWRALFRLKSKNRIYYERKLAIDSIIKQIELNAKETDLVETLSLGQRKLLSFAKALILKPKLLIVDEITSGLDKDYLGKIKKILKDFKKNGNSVLISDQDLNFVLEIADKIVVLDSGQEIAMGTPGKIKNNKKVLEAYNS